jgi:DNA-binding transcriptional LysR family regulator
LGSPFFFASVGEPVVPADLLARQAVIYGQRGGGALWTFRRGATEASVTLKGRISVTAAEGMREAVIAGLGFAVASEWMFAPELAGGSVKEVLADWQLPALDLWAVFPTGRRAGAKARAFTAFIESQAMSPNFSVARTSRDVSTSKV